MIGLAAVAVLLVGGGLVVLTREPVVAQPAVVLPLPVPESRASQLLERAAKLEPRLQGDEAKRAELSTLRTRLATPNPTSATITEIEAALEALERSAQPP